MLSECSVCGKSRFDEDKKLIWQSDLNLVSYYYNGKATKITVCPKCRELPLNEIFQKTIVNISKNIIYTKEY
jgi:hypothetical protein